jgi:hypothetical protein
MEISGRWENDADLRKQAWILHNEELDKLDRAPKIVMLLNGGYSGLDMLL